MVAHCTSRLFVREERKVMHYMMNGGFSLIPGRTCMMLGRKKKRRSPDPDTVVYKELLIRI